VIFVDSSIWIDYFNGKSSPEVTKLDSLLGVESVSTGDLILVEVLQGFRNDKDYKIAKNLLTSLTVFNILDSNIAIKNADNFRTLRKKGITVRKTVDSIIATFCIQNKLSLLHSDKDFKPFHKHLRLKNAI